MSALVAGVLGGLVISAVQSVTTTPLILQAEKYETASSATPASGPKALATHAANDAHSPAPGAGAPHDHGEAWAPEDGMQRVFFTVMTNVIVGFGFALLVVAGFALSGRRVDVTSGGLWGLGGFTVFTLAPGLGLPPELPGTAAAIRVSAIMAEARKLRKRFPPAISVPNHSKLMRSAPAANVLVTKVRGTRIEATGMRKKFVTRPAS